MLRGPHPLAVLSRAQDSVGDVGGRLDVGVGPGVEQDGGLVLMGVEEYVCNSAPGRLSKANQSRSLGIVDPGSSLQSRLRFRGCSPPPGRDGQGMRPCA